MGKRVFWVAVGIVCLAAAPNASANLLANAGFETGDFTSWTVGGNSIATGVDVDGTVLAGESPFPPNYSNVRSGTYAGWAIVQNGIDPVERILLTQTVAVVANTDYDIGFWMGNDSASTFGMSIDDAHTQIFVNGVGQLSAPNFSFPAGSTSADFLLFDTIWNSGAATMATITFAINGSGTSRVGVSFDDFFVDGPAVVPEPATMSLLAMGLLGFAIRNRRRRV